MGEYRMGPPSDLVKELQEAFNIECFVETGTFKGTTAFWASSYFRRVISIESSETLHAEAVNRYKAKENIQFVFGSSPERLREMSELREPCLFWLDAHWCEENTDGQAYQCPLLHEIEVINRSGAEHFILIDDARFFLSTPPPPNVPSHWPDISATIEKLNAGSAMRTIVVAEDVVIAVPLAAKSLITRYCEELHQQRLRRRLRPIVQDVRHALQNPSKAARRLFSFKV